jgi:hypothetical protein
MKKHIITFFKGLGGCLLMTCAIFALVMGIMALCILHTLPAWAAIGLFLLDVVWIALIILLIWCVGLFMEDY